MHVFNTESRMGENGLYSRVNPRAGQTEHRLLKHLFGNYDTDARGVASNATVRVEIQLLLLRIQGLVSATPFLNIIMKITFGQFLERRYMTRCNHLIKGAL